MAAPKLTMQEEMIVAAITEDPGISNARLSRKTKIPVREVTDLVKRPVVQRAIQDVREAITGDALISTRRLIEEELHLAYYDPADIFDKEGNELPVVQMPERIRRAISRINVNITKEGIKYYSYVFADKGKSLERLEKHMGFFELDNKQKQGKIIFIRHEDAGDYVDVTPEEGTAEKKIEVVPKPIALLD